MNPRSSTRCTLALTAAALSYAACGSSAPKSLIGTWAVDFDATWKESLELFLKDTLRGGAAYPKDPVEKAKVVEKEMREFLAPTRFEFTEPATLSCNLGGKAQKATYTQAPPSGDLWKLTVAKPLDHEAQIEWLAADRIRYAMVRNEKVRMRLILRRG